MSALLRWWLAFCLLMAPLQALATGKTPGSYTYYVWPNRTVLGSVEFSLTPLVDPGYSANLFWSNQFDFVGGQTAYTGMQSNGGDPRQFLFSVWDAVEARPGSPGSECHPFGGEGRGRSCKMLYNWKQGHRFVFKVTHEGQRWFGVTVADMDAGTSFKLGSIRASATHIATSGMQTWTEYFEWNNDSATCLNQPYSQVRIGLPQGNGGTVAANVDSSETSDNCKHQTRIDTNAEGTVQTNAIGNSLRGPVTEPKGACLDAFGGADSGTAAITYQCNGQDNQAWVLAMDGSLQLAQGLCLHVTKNTRLPGSKVIVYSCQKGGDQRWDRAGRQLKSRASGLCLTAHDGAQLTVETCTPGTVNQTWHLPLAPAGPL